MLAPLRIRSFALLWTGGLISALGDWMLFIALPFVIYDLTGSVLATGAMFIAETAPRLLLGTVAGVFADRWDRRVTMIIADLLRAGVLLLLLLVHSRELVWVIYVAAFAESALGQFFDPAKSALLPRLVSPEQLVPANALNALGFDLTRLVGPALGGMLLAAVGLPVLVLIDIASYLLSAILIFFVAAPPNPSPAHAQNDEGDNMASPSVWHDWLAGWQLVLQKRWIATLFTAMGFAMIGQGLTNVLLVPFVNDILHGSAREFGWMVTAQSIGGITGGLVLGQVNRRLRPVWMIGISALALGVIMFAIGNIPFLPAVIVCVAIAGWPAIGFFVGESTLLQSGVEDAYRGRIFGMFSTSQALMMLCGLGLGSVLTEPMGVVLLFDCIGGLYILAGLVVLLRLHDAPAVGEVTA